MQKTDRKLLVASLDSGKEGPKELNLPENPPEITPSVKSNNQPLFE